MIVELPEKGDALTTNESNKQESAKQEEVENTPKENETNKVSLIFHVVEVLLLFNSHVYTCFYYILSLLWFVFIKIQNLLRMTNGMTMRKK